MVNAKLAMMVNGPQTQHGGTGRQATKNPAEAGSGLQGERRNDYMPGTVRLNTDSIQRVSG